MIADKLDQMLEQLEDARKIYALELEVMPEGKLMRSNGRYYSATRTGGKYNRRGITKNPELIKLYARKELLTRAIPILDHNIELVRHAIKGYEPCDPDGIIQTLSATFKSLPPEAFLNPQADILVLSLDAVDQQRIASHMKWGNEPYEPPDYKPDGRTLRTSRGLRMRSKSEVLIAEKLYEYGIAFRYEQPLELGGATLHPDFTFEGAGGELFYLEFCGMMDVPSYVNSFKWRRSLYEEHGINEWTNMIYVYASDNNIDMMHVDHIVRDRVIPWL